MHLSSSELEKRKRFLSNIFKHILKQKPSDIAEAVLLISFSDDQANLFDELASTKRSPSEKIFPRLFTFDNKVKLVDTSESFLQPEI
jgi:hypothetical protein